MSMLRRFRAFKFAIAIAGVGTLVIGTAIAPIATSPVFAQEEEEPDATEELQEEAIDLPFADMTLEERRALAEQARTTGNVEIPLGELRWLLRPIPLGQLQIEADAWFFLMQAQAKDVADAEIAVDRENRRVQEAQRAIAALENAREVLADDEISDEEALERVEEALEEAREQMAVLAAVEEEIEEDEDIREAIEEAEETAEERAEERGEEPTDRLFDGPEPDADVDEASEDLDRLLEGDAEPDVEEGEADADAGLNGELEADPEAMDTEPEEVSEREGAEAALSDPEAASEAMAAISAELTEAIEGTEEDKTNLLEALTEQRNDQTALSERFKLVLDALAAKGGDDAAYRAYLDAITVIEVEVTDTQAFWSTITGWLRSEEGGIRWLINISQFLGIVLASLIVSWISRLILKKGLAPVQSMSQFLKDFVVLIVSRGVVVAGVLLGLTALEVSLGPLLALVGGASFVLAFALQSNLGNFASGLMIMFTKPFDVNDEVEIGGYWALVKDISLANTVLETWGQGRTISMPNSSVWGGTIVNHTRNDGVRKLSEVICVNLNEDLMQVKQIIDDILHNHPLVLKDYWAGSFVWKVKDVVEVCYIARCKADDYWTLYEDLILQMCSRFREVGITLTVPEYRVALDSAVNKKAYSHIEDLSDPGKESLSQDVMGVGVEAGAPG